VVTQRIPENLNGVSAELGDVIVDIQDPISGNWIHNRIVRGIPKEFGESDKDPKRWAARVIYETREFKKILEGK
jgi:hypothetical protein